jgi:hypothetical protein
MSTHQTTNEIQYKNYGRPTLKSNSLNIIFGSELSFGNRCNRYKYMTRMSELHQDKPSENDAGVVAKKKGSFKIFIILLII